MKLVADDPDENPGRDVLRQYYRDHSNRYATSYCVTEALSAFKLKFLRKRISEDQYIGYVKKFIGGVIGANLQIDEVSILLPIVRTEAERLIRTHGIDFLDAFQIVTVLQGRYRHMAGDSKTILITADRGLAAAARAEGVRAWECTSESPPV